MIEFCKNNPGLAFTIIVLAFLLTDHIVTILAR